MSVLAPPKSPFVATRCSLHFLYRSFDAIRRLIRDTVASLWAPEGGVEQTLEDHREADRRGMTRP
jgi:hypothetical protein